MTCMLFVRSLYDAEKFIVLVMKQFRIFLVEWGTFFSKKIVFYDIFPNLVNAPAYLQSPLV